MNQTNLLYALPEDWSDRVEEVVSDMLRIWEQEFEDGRDLSAAEICPEAPQTVLEQFAEGVQCLRAFAQFSRDSFSLVDAPFDAANYRAGQYQAESVIDQGGQGVILKAYDCDLGRMVALKTLKEKGILGREPSQRLEREAKIIGALEHPGVIPVYGFGRDAEGNPYYAMRHMPGKRTLRHVIDDVRSQRDPSQRAIEFQQLLQQFITVCETVNYAHSKNVIHRDLKPTNILVGDFGEVFVLDFGIAKSLDSEQDFPLPNSAPADEYDTHIDANTRAGAMGTPAYMSPEQAENAAAVDKASDTYALGATLYHILAGEAPFVATRVDKLATTIDQTNRSQNILDRVKSGDLPAARQIDPSAPPALEAVCQKAMSKDPAARYENAGELASEIRRFLADEPVQAYADPWTTHVRRWVKRNRTLVVGAVAALLVAVVALSIASRQLAIANGETRTALVEANKQKDRAQTAEKAERKRAGELEQANIKLREFLRTTYLNEFQVAHTAWSEMDILRADGILDKWEQHAKVDEDLRSFEWGYLKRMHQGELPVLREMDPAPEKLMVSRNGKTILATQKIGEDYRHAVTVVDAETKATAYETTTDYFIPRAVTATLSDDGSKLATFVEVKPPDEDSVLTSSKREIVVRDLKTGDEQRIPFNNANQGATFVMQFHSEGKELQILFVKKQAEMKLELQRWEIESAKMLASVHLGSPLQTGVISPDGKRVALWDLTPSYSEAGFSPEDLRICDAETGKELQRLKQHNGLIFEAAFSADSKQLATASENTTVKLWDVASGRLTAVLQGHRDEVKAVAFSPDGARVATGGIDRSVRVWRAATGRLLFTLRGHTGAVQSVAFASDSKLLSASEDGRLIEWPVKPQSVETIDGISGAMQVAFSPDSKRLYFGLSAPLKSEKFPTIQIRDPHDATISELPIQCERFSLSDEGEVLVALSHAGDFEIWSVEEQKKLRTVKGVYQWCHEFALSPDGKWLAYVSDAKDFKPKDQWTDDDTNIFDGDDKPFWLTVHVMELKTGKIVQSLKGHYDQIERLEFRPGGNELAVVHRNDMAYHLWIWNARTGKAVHKIDTKLRMRHRGEDPPLAYSADGKWLATGGLTNDQKSAVVVRNAATAKVIQTLTGFKGKDVTSVAFTIDGRRLVTTSMGREVKLWDVASGQPVLTFPGVKQLPYIARFSPDGSRLAVACGNDITNGEILIWRGTPLE